MSKSEKIIICLFSNYLYTRCKNIFNKFFMTFSQENNKTPNSLSSPLIFWTIFWLWIWYIIGWFFPLQTSFTEVPSLQVASGEISVPTSLRESILTPKTEKIFSLIEKNYYGFKNISPEKREDAFIHSLVASMGDKHSEYFNIDETKEFTSELNGDFEGIGAVIGEVTEGVKIEKVIVWSPAEKSGLKVGDTILSVNAVSLAWKKATEAVKEIRGLKWTVAHLEYISDGQKKTIDVMRDVVNIPSVEAKILEGTSIGYIQINTFWEHTPDEFIKALEYLTWSGATGLILDFRFNGWGYLDSAVKMLSNILPNHTAVVTTKENNPANNETYFTEWDAIVDTNLPIVLLVNEYSASASEIFAWALKDYDRAVLIGTKTYWKWSVQQPFDIGDGSMVKITVANWFTPKGKNINEEGIIPDMVVDFTPEDYKKTFDRQLEVAKKAIMSQLSQPTSINLWKEEIKKITIQ